MIRCRACGNSNLDTSQYCDECGAKLVAADVPNTDFTGQRPQTAEVPIFSAPNATSVGTSSVAKEPRPNPNSGSASPKGTANATLTIERGDAAGAQFPISRDESVIGRWDADNGIFPDIDLDTYDQEAKVSRRHARILLKDGKYFVEDLGSTNGTYINRGRRLLPGTPQPLSDGDEIIVGKTFLRFHVRK
jgi:pSer/pThr/pTyr-binding forkhead associated (FHA) protein